MMKRFAVALAALVAIGCASRPTEPSANEATPSSSEYELKEWQLGPGSWSLTCDEAASDAIELLSESSKDEVRSTPRDELFRFYRLGWGLTIRNRQGVWRGNLSLIESCLGSKDGHPEDASIRIIERAWEKLQ